MAQSSSTFAAASGDGYELQMGRFSRLLANQFLDFAGLIDAGRVLDAGCGTGALSAELLRRTERAQVVGIDFSPVYVAHASESTKNPRAAFEIGDLTSLSFADDSFEQVYSQLVLQFVPNIRSPQWHSLSPPLTELRPMRQTAKIALAHFT